MNNKINYYIEKILERLDKQKEIASNPQYIIWLEKFTEKYPRFTDDEFLYEKKKKSPKDIEEVNNLSLLFEVIEKYAQDNYIYITKNSDFSGSYKIKYNNIGYEIGCMAGQGTLFFCGRIENPDDTFIDYNDILLNKKQPNTEKFDDMMEKFSIIINYYHEQGIPAMALKRSLNIVIKDLLKEEKNINKPLIISKTITK